MQVRPMVLPNGWYPKTPGEVEKQLKEWKKRYNIDETQGEGVAGIVPHAGWAFSGALAYRVISGLKSGLDTVIIIGGHMAGDKPPYVLSDDSYESPFGPIETDKQLAESVGTELELEYDRYADNTVEVQVPIVRALYPQAKLLGFRTAPGQTAIRLGKALFQHADKLGRSIAVIGSTDLTHYGPNYGYSPKGTGPQAVKWVKEENDKKMIDALCSMKLQEIISLSHSDKSACSAGGAAAAVEYARQSGAQEGKLIDYYTSKDIMPGDSFVGYAGILYL
ncbi:MAG: AmmeMemoRadiSam system protein B [Spirochaetia bacterium]